MAQQIRLSKGLTATPSRCRLRAGFGLSSGLLPLAAPSGTPLHPCGSMGKRGCSCSHRFLLGAPRGRLVIFEDGNGLNCVRTNIRLGGRSESSNIDEKQTRQGTSRTWEFTERAIAGSGALRFVWVAALLISAILRTRSKQP